MTYFESKEAASRLDISIRRIQQMCKSGEIDGDKKENGQSEKKAFRRLS